MRSKKESWISLSPPWWLVGCIRSSARRLARRRLRSRLQQPLGHRALEGPRPNVPEHFSPGPRRGEGKSGHADVREGRPGNDRREKPRGAKARPGDAAGFGRRRQRHFYVQRVETFQLGPGEDVDLLGACGLDFEFGNDRLVPPFRRQSLEDVNDGLGDLLGGKFWGKLQVSCLELRPTNCPIQWPGRRRSWTGP